jgi:rhomboid family GlyGly-CTERM serine protease
MNRQNIPILTLGLVALLFALHLLAPDRTLLFFSAADVRAGELWRALTGHLVHADAGHLLWNCLGLLVLGAIIERRSRLDWWLALLTGMASVDVLLLSPFSQLQYYCGLSGALNTLLLLALWGEWRDSRSLWVAVLFLACVAKVVVELSSGDSLLTNISWPPYAWSHLAGLLGGGVLICIRSGLALSVAPGPKRGARQPVKMTREGGRASATLRP